MLYTNENKLIVEAYTKILTEATAVKREEKEIDGFKVKFVLVKDLEWEEYIIKVYINGKEDEPSSYHSMGITKDDKQDALDTLDHMSKNFKIPSRCKKSVVKED